MQHAEPHTPEEWTTAYLDMCRRVVELRPTRDRVYLVTPCPWRAPRGFPRRTMACQTPAGEREGWATYVVSAAKVLAFAAQHGFPVELASHAIGRMAGLRHLFTEGNQ